MHGPVRHLVAEIVSRPDTTPVVATAPGPLLGVRLVDNGTRVAWTVKDLDRRRARDIVLSHRKIGPGIIGTVIVNKHLVRGRLTGCSIVSIAVEHEEAIVDIFCFHVGHDQVVPTESLVLIHLPRIGEGIVGVVIIMHGQDNLMEIVLAAHAVGRFADLLHGRQQQPDQNGNNGDNHKQFDQCKPLAPHHSIS